MNKEEHQIELIEKFISKNTTDKEVEEFDKLISEDQSFQYLYKEMSVLIPGIENSARKLLLNDLIGIEDKLPVIQSQSIIQPKRKIRWITWSAAAAACLIGLVLSITLLNSGNNRYSEVYNQYYKPYNSLAIANNRSEDASNTIKAEAFERYTAGDYTNAIEHLERLNKTMQDSEIQFYLANAYMATGQLSKAEENFNLVLAKESLFNDHAKWFLALCYLKTNRTDKACKKFNELANYSNTYTKNAKEILNLVK